MHINNLLWKNTCKYRRGICIKIWATSDGIIWKKFTLHSSFPLCWCVNLRINFESIYLQAVQYRYVIVRGIHGEPYVSMHLAGFRALIRKLTKKQQTSRARCREHVSLCQFDVPTAGQTRDIALPYITTAGDPFARPVI